MYVPDHKLVSLPLANVKHLIEASIDLLFLECNRVLKVYTSAARLIKPLRWASDLNNIVGIEIICC